MLIAELAGPSGVGKSAIYDMLSNPNEITPNPKPILAEALNGIPTNDKFSKLIQRIVRTAKGPRIERRADFLYRSYFKYILAAQSKGKPMVIDGGLVQRGLAVEQLNSDVTLNEFWQAIPAPDVLFMVWADKKTLLDRNKKRGGDHDRSWQIDMALVHFSRARWALRERGIHVVVIDATQSIQRNAQYILEVLKGLS